MLQTCHEGKFKNGDFSFSRIFCWTSADGDPVNLKILYIYSISDSPLKSGSPVAISARRQPRVNMSTSNEYMSFLIKISGDLYHSLRASLPDRSLSLGSSGVYD